MRLGTPRGSALVLATLLAALPACATAQETLPQAQPAFSPYIEANGVLYVSGHLPFAPGSDRIEGDDVFAQTHRVIRNMEATLVQARSGLHEMVRVTVYLTSMDDFPRFNAAYAALIQQPWPARTTVAVRALARGARIEMSCVAVRGYTRATAPPD